MATSPPSGSENAAAKVPKDRNCPFCLQSFTSSSLGRHLDLYIKPKNPKPPDGVHDVDEIRKLRGNITRRQSRVASIRRDSSTPAGPASARYLLDDNRSTSTPDSRRVSWSVNKPGWEATGVMNDLPPRFDSRTGDRRDSTKRDQLKADLDHRQRLAEELDTGKAAQLALRDILDTVRNAEASATGRHLFDDFDFFQQSFPNLCLRLLSPSPPLDSPLSISASDSWSSNIPWEEQRDALSRAVEERAQLLRRRSGPQSPVFEEASANNLSLDKFHTHINHVFDLWRNLTESNRRDIWQREILRNYVRIEKELKEAQITIAALRREVDHFALRLDRMTSSSSSYSPYQSRHHSLSVPPSPMGISEEILGDLCRQGFNVREWDYERLMDRWKTVVRDERRASAGLSAQRSFSTSSQGARVIQAAANLSVNGRQDSTASRSDSIASAMSAAPDTRNSSLDSAALDADAEGEDEDVDGENIAPDAQPSFRRNSHVPPTSHPDLHHTSHPQSQPPPLQRLPSDPRMTDAPRPPRAQIDPDYKWPQPQQVDETTPTPYTSLTDPGSTIKRLPPGPESWHAEMQHAASHNMEGLEGPAAAATSVPTTTVG